MEIEEEPSTSRGRIRFDFNEGNAVAKQQSPVCGLCGPCQCQQMNQVTKLSLSSSKSRMTLCSRMLMVVYGNNPLQVLREDMIKQLDELKSQLDKAKNNKKDQKTLIQKWMDGFERDNGRSPTKTDKEVVRPMFSAYKDLERQCKDLIAQIDPLESRLLQISASSLAELEPRINTLEEHIEKKTGDRKAKKHEIQAWLDDFSKQNGREASKSDKELVRPMFNRYKELEKEARELTEELNELKNLREELKQRQPIDDMEKTTMAILSPKSGNVMDKTFGADMV